MRLGDGRVVGDIVWLLKPGGSFAVGAACRYRKLKGSLRPEAHIPHAYPQMPFRQIQAGLVRFGDA